MSPQNKLALITMDKHTGTFLLEQLNLLLGDSVFIESYTTQDTVREFIKADVVIVSTGFIKTEVEKKFIFHPNSKVIYARRTIGKHGISSLLNIPNETRGILFVDHEDVSRDVIHSIKHLGINHLDLKPEQVDQSNFETDIIITAGKTDLLTNIDIPVIDIGVLRLDISTIFEVLLSLNLLEKKAAFVSSKYNREIIELCQEVSEALYKATVFSEELEVTINSNRDGIIVIDNNGTVILSNKSVECLLGITKERISGLEFTKDNGFPWDWRQLSTIDNSILRINDFKLVVNSRPVKIPIGQISTMLTFRDVTEIERLEAMVRRDRAEKGHVAKFRFEDLIGNSEELKNAILVARQEAQTEATVLIYGESGVGKELFAQAIHNESNRRKGAFVAVNFSAVAQSLMESELFGYEDGAFTGAKKGGKPGVFELAHGGTIFLDEIGDASLALQTRLLRVLQEKQVMRVGATKIIPVDVRVIAATNRNLFELVRTGAFREDLYYRLNVLPLNVPPLRERQGDLEELFKTFFAHRGRQFRMSEQTLKLLEQYAFPGNIRELLNVVEYLCCTTAIDTVIQPSNLPKYILQALGGLGPKIDQPVLEKEHVMILNQIKTSTSNGRSVGRRSLAASLPGMSEAQLRTHLKTLEDNGFVVLFSGRKGTKLTTKAQNFLNKYQIESQNK